MENETTSKIVSNIREDINISGSVNTDNGIQIMYMSCSLNRDTFGANINVVVNDKELYKANAVEVQAKYKEFKDLAEKRANELGNIIF
ncbi:hypothetical protein [Clostridium sardiniense]|uniref:hypothetical protein n=1 Tax=Clostridium sardiniense TaxID=29369 RepID=UPI00195E2AE9|nr:hypothetical protein [Clostridium sardiniense]MBM7835705.1 hypothetical protein [Clostridium sardiniense]